MNVIDVQTVLQLGVVYITWMMLDDGVGDCGCVFVRLFDVLTERNALSVTLPGESTEI